MDRKTIPVAAALALLATVPGGAQEADPDEAAALERLTVTATALGEHAEDLPLPMDVIGGDELLLKSGGGSLGEVLANEPGITGTYFGPVASRPVIRGQSGPRVRMLQDRIGSLDVSDISPDHAVSVEPLFARQIEILRGPATLLYGSGAEGGVINVVTNRVPTQDPEGLLDGAFEIRADTALDERTGLGLLEGRAGQINWHLEGVDRETDDVEIEGFAEREGLHDGEDVGEEQLPEGMIPNSDSDSASWSGGLAWTGTRGHLGAAYTRYRSRYGLPGESHAHGEEEDDAEAPALFAGPRIRLDQERVDVRGEWRPEAGAISALRLHAGHSDYQHRELEPNGATGTTFDDDSLEVRAELVHELGGWNGVAGTQYTDRDFSALGDEAYLPRTQSRSVGLFMLEERHVGELKVSLGGRIEKTRHDPEASARRYDETALSGSLGFVRHFGPFALAMNVGYTERHPGPEELYASGPHLATRLFELGDDALAKERNRSVDVGLGSDGDALVAWSVSFFMKDAVDYIFLATTGGEEDGLPRAEYRQGNAAFYGYEAQIQAPLLSLGTGELVGRAWSDFVRGRLDDAPGNRNLPRVPEQRHALGLDWVATVWETGVEAVRHMGQTKVADFESATGNYTELGAHLLYHFDTAKAETTFFLRGSNLLGEDGRRHVSFLKDFAPLPGRSLEAGFRVGFQ